MSKPENVLIIDPAQELKFRGEFEMKKKSFVRENFHLQIKQQEWSQSCAINSTLAITNCLLHFASVQMCCVQCKKG